MRTDFADGTRLSTEASRLQQTCPSCATARRAAWAASSYCSAATASANCSDRLGFRSYCSRSVSRSSISRSTSSSSSNCSSASYSANRSRNALQSAVQLLHGLVRAPTSSSVASVAACVRWNSTNGRYCSCDSVHSSSGEWSRDKVHEGQRMVGVGGRAAKLPQRQPAHAAVIELHELAIGLAALLGVQARSVARRRRRPALSGGRNRSVRRRAAGRRAGPASSSCKTPISTRICSTSRPSAARTSRALISPGS